MRKAATAQKSARGRCGGTGAPQRIRSRKNTMPDEIHNSTGRFDIAAIAGSLPETATTLLVDKYLTNREQASARVFRVYRPTPPHYHATCDEYLYVVSGRGTFWMKDPATKAEFAPGELLFFERGTVHAIRICSSIPSSFSPSIRRDDCRPTSYSSIRATDPRKHSWRAMPGRGSRPCVTEAASAARPLGPDEVIGEYACGREPRCHAFGNVARQMEPARRKQPRRR
jgi:mannose-6-phosphate isomerase-like protein (cupin superfamily)